MPGRLQNFMPSMQTLAFGLSTAIGVSVTDWIRSIIQCRVSTSPSSTLAQQSM